MSIDVTTQAIENMANELTAATSGSGEFSCSRIQKLIDEHVKSVTDIITQKAESMKELMGTWAPILNVPKNPLKLVKWALKVAFGPAALYVEQAIKQIRSIVQLVSAIANLAGAVAQAAARLVACLETAIAQALNDITDSLLDQAASLMSFAEGMVDQLVNDILEDTGINDVLAEVEGLGADADQAFSNLTNAARQTQNAKSRIRNIGPPIIPGVT